MNELPSYFSVFSKLLPEEVIGLLVSIENSFFKLQYEDHYSKLEDWFGDYEGIDEQTQLKSAISFYKEHIETVLRLQGITLVELEVIPFPILVNILSTVTLFSTSNLVDVFEGLSFEEYPDNESLLAERLAKVNDLPITDFLQYIEDVDDSTISILRYYGKEEESVVEIDKEHLKEVKAYIKTLKETKSNNYSVGGIIAEEYIKSLGTVGFSIGDALDSLPDISHLSTADYGVCISLLLRASSERGSLRTTVLDEIKSVGSEITNIAFIASAIDYLGKIQIDSLEQDEAND